MRKPDEDPTAAQGIHLCVYKCVKADMIFECILHQFQNLPKAFFLLKLYTQYLYTI